MTLYSLLTAIDGAHTPQLVGGGVLNHQAIGYCELSLDQQLVSYCELALVDD